MQMSWLHKLQPTTLGIYNAFCMLCMCVCMHVCVLRMKPKKCNFCCEQVCYLGHVVSEAGIAVNQEKVEAVRSFPQPTNLKKLRSFLGLAIYYRRFNPNFSKVAGPLYALTKMNVEFSWTPKCKEVFENLKELLTTNKQAH